MPNRSERRSRRPAGPSPLGDVTLRIFAFADHAAVSPGDGKLYINGANISTQWLQTIPGNAGPLFLVLLFAVPWSHASERKPFAVRLLDSDRQPIGEDPLMAGEFEVGRPAGTTPGEELTVPIVVSLAGLRVEREGLSYFHVTVQERELGVQGFKWVLGLPPQAMPGRMSPGH